jgi:Trypsin-like peptidase domain
MHDFAINEHSRLATLERIAKYTVGIAVHENRGIGTGTFVTDGKGHYILTAAHVIDGADVTAAHFFIRPDKALIEKPAIETTSDEVGSTTVGINIPIIGVARDPDLDVAILTIDPSFVLPEPAEFYQLAKSHDFATWPEEKLDDVSLHIFGFPTANARPIEATEHGTLYFLGAASMLVRYSASLNETGFKTLNHTVSKEKDFLFEYTGMREGIHPRGFSGCGAWVVMSKQGARVWSIEPLLVGVVHSYFSRSKVLAATKLPRIIRFELNESG